jgi:hypothetical protein
MSNKEFLENVVKVTPKTTTFKPLIDMLTDHSRRLSGLDESWSKNIYDCLEKLDRLLKAFDGEVDGCQPHEHVRVGAITKEAETIPELLLDVENKTSQIDENMIGGFQELISYLNRLDEFILGTGLEKKKSKE